MKELLDALKKAFNTIDYKYSSNVRNIPRTFRVRRLKRKPSNSYYRYELEIDVFHGDQDTFFKYSTNDLIKALQVESGLAVRETDYSMNNKETEIFYIDIYWNKEIK